MTTHCLRCGLTPNALIHNQGPGWVNTHPFDGGRVAQSKPITVHSDLGAAWLTRGGDQMYVERHEVPAVVAALLVELDRLDDAADMAATS